MNKLINGKRYDTKKAEYIESADNGKYRTDFDHFCESLYKKRTGEFFLHLEGGANSRVAKQSSGGWIGGAEIQPLPYEDAVRWVEKNLTADKYAELFGEPDEGIVAATIKISAAMKSKLEQEASRTGKTQSKIVEELLEKL